MSPYITVSSAELLISQFQYMPFRSADYKDK